MYNYGLQRKPLHRGSPKSFVFTMNALCPLDKHSIYLEYSYYILHTYAVYVFTEFCFFKGNVLDKICPTNARTRGVLVSALISKFCLLLNPISPALDATTPYSVT